MAVNFIQKTVESSSDIEGANIQPQFVNRFQVVVGLDHVRVIFGDAAVSKDATYHSAVVMTLNDARELGELLYRLVVKPAQRAEQPPASAPTTATKDRP